MSFQLTPTGLQTQTQQEIVDQIAAKERSTFGNNTNTSTSSILGQLNNIEAEFDALNQQVALAVYNSMDPDLATGVALDARAALTGSVRQGATNSSVFGQVGFTGPGTVSNGDLFSNDDTQTQWQVVGGPYTDTGGPYLPEIVAVALAAVDTGALIANANTNWSLVTANPAIDGFTNPTDDANPGRDQETDPDFRVRRQVELYAGNIGGLLAISAVVSKVDGVIGVRTYHNPATPGFDSDGIPFKASETVVETNPTPPGAALIQSIADAIFSAQGAGGQAFGNALPYSENTVTDIEGNAHTGIGFSLVTLVDVFALVTISTVSTEQAISTNMASVTQTALLEHAQENFNDLGQNQLGFEWSGVVADLQEAGQISGAVTVTVQLSRTGLGGPYADPLQISIRERPDFDLGAISVVVV